LLLQPFPAVKAFCIVALFRYAAPCSQDSDEVKDRFGDEQVVNHLAQQLVLVLVEVDPAPDVEEQAELEIAQAELEVAQAEQEGT
jgi:hypothetical protein